MDMIQVQFGEINDGETCYEYDSHKVLVGYRKTGARSTELISPAWHKSLGERRFDVSHNEWFWVFKRPGVTR